MKKVYQTHTSNGKGFWFSFAPLTLSLWNVTFFYVHNKSFIAYSVNIIFLSVRFNCIPIYSHNNLPLGRRRRKHTKKKKKTEKQPKKFSIYLLFTHVLIVGAAAFVVFVVVMILFDFFLFSLWFSFVSLSFFFFLILYSECSFRWKISTRRNEYVWITTLLHHHLYRSDRAMAAQPIVYILHTQIRKPLLYLLRTYRRHCIDQHTMSLLFVKKACVCVCVRVCMEKYSWQSSSMSDTYKVHRFDPLPLPIRSPLVSI